MPSIRIGLTTDFNLVGEQVGIGTTNPTATLEVAGEIRANNISAPSGITSFTEYTGFLQPVQLISNTVSIAETTKGNLNSLSDEIKISGEVTIEPDVSVTGGRLDSLTTTDRFAVPLGEINNRDNAPEAGTTRFNQDFGTLEFFDGVNWKTVNSYNRGDAAGRGVLGGGRSPSDSAIIDYIQIMTTGNAVSFGDLLVARTDSSCFSSEVRGLWAGGGAPTASTHIDYVTIASAGNGVDFGDTATSSRASGAACSSSTRGVYAQGINSNTLQYVEIDTKGNALDFGDLSANLNEGTGFGSPTRGIFLRGNGSYGFDAITIASKGNGIDFGEDCVSVQGGRLHTRGAGGCSNSIRGVVAGGGDGAGNTSQTSKIRHLTISTGGTATVFGDLTFETRLAGSLANPTRGVFSGGLNDPSNIKTINYVTIASTGDATDYGDLTEALHAHNGCSDSHGGLGGF